MATVNLGPVETPSISITAAPSRFRLGDLAERGAGCLLLALSSPVIAASTLVVAALSRRSPFVAHRRVGQHGREFWVLKLRTMWTRGEPAPRERRWIEYIDATPIDNGKAASDPRITSQFAAFCRRHSIDEFPQLWHVARGEMSLVGPRPLTRAELVRHYGHRAAELVRVKPGLTGLWQVYGRSAVRFPQRTLMDLEMVRTLTPRMYLKILLRTLPEVISGKNAW